jgi:hypothetical protein
MSYIRSNGRSLRGLSGPENCMTSQDWDPNCSGSWGTGQCVPRGMAGKAPGCTYAAPSSSSSGGVWDLLGKITSGVTDVIKAKATPAPVTNVINAGGGMSTTTKVALAGAAALGVVLVLRSRKK